jgi:threonine dehydrogenase-like Zn-dependent dehydrogenase
MGRRMMAFVITRPHEAGVVDVPNPVAAPGEVVVDVRRAGVCGTDVEFFTGAMAYLHDGQAAFPLRIGHEWAGVVTELGPGVDRTWLGRRVTGDTMLGCGTCHRCRAGRHHVCADREEIGIRGGRPGALAERMAIPARALRALPDSVDDAVGAMVEPGGNALRAVEAANVHEGERLLILGTGTIGLLAGLFAGSRGIDVHLLGRSARSMAFARSLEFDSVWDGSSLPDLPWAAVIDATNAPEMPSRAVELVEPGGRVALIGLASVASQVDTRRIALKDVTVVGILSASPALDRAIEAYASSQVDPRGLIAATIPLEEVADVLAGKRPSDATDGPKVQVVPTT